MKAKKWGEYLSLESKDRIFSLFKRNLKELTDNKGFLDSRMIMKAIEKTLERYDYVLREVILESIEDKI